ncbi:zinc ribbon domain-containing protein [Butyrivibrio sp. AC2005]|uniref:zinc ribbon domain-containing protein n=1 Tax=Butyrivibrio sp. AC2005 TaxID=1280672 RepID=UPI0003FC76D8|nr:zinc ribbon domain-containing protein [Butyrivibrio sp. AC2005]
MFCTNCGTEIMKGHLYCTSCGTKAPDLGQRMVPQSQVNYTYQNGMGVAAPKKSHKGLVLVIALLTVFFIGILSWSGYFIYGLMQEAVQAGTGNNSGLSAPGENTYSEPEEPDSPVETGNSVSETTVGNSEDPFYGYKNLSFTSYSLASYANDGDAAYVVPNGTVNADTVIYNGITAGEYADYVDNKVLEKGRTLNRDFYYDLLSIYLVDPSLCTDEQAFAISMIYASTVSNQFHDTPVRLEAVRIPNNNRNLYSYKINAYGKDDIWVSDAANKKFYFNNGKTEYSSTMYDDNTFGLWYLAVKDFFGIEVE